MEFTKKQKKHYGRLLEERARNTLLLNYSIKRREVMFWRAAPQEFIDRYDQDIQTFSRRLAQLECEIGALQDQLYKGACDR